MVRSDAPTAEFDLSQWVPPVETKADLWSFAREGQLCFVKDDGCVYERRDKSWVLHSGRKTIG